MPLSEVVLEERDRASAVMKPFPGTVHERSCTCIASNVFENVECVAIVRLSSSLNSVARQVVCGPSPRETTSRRGSR